MKLYKREDFIKLPPNTIYSRVQTKYLELCYGLYCKTSGDGVDWVEQDLIAEAGFPNKIDDAHEALMYQIDLRDSFKDFKTDLDCGGRDGMFETSDTFVVWDTEDMRRLYDYLGDCLNIKQL